MTTPTMNFKRYETKYLITVHQQALLMKEIGKLLSPDEYGKSTICNVYYDTPDFRLIRRSLEKPLYKEKLRLRSYGIVQPDNKVFAEIKKKYDGIVYKRRITAEELTAMNLFNGKNGCTEESQIQKEIAFTVKRYENIKPQVFISYDREAYFDKCDNSFRITFDKNILWRDYDLSLSSGIYGNPILPANYVLMEVKCSGAMPLWFTAALSKQKIYKTSFSKYGRAYEALLNNKGGQKYA